MARIVITRPNGETEYAELTTEKARAGNDRLTVEKAGTVYYAKLDSGVGTHMYVVKPDGRKLYVQKTLAKPGTLVKFDYEEYWDGDLSHFDFRINNARPREISRGVELSRLQKAEMGRDTKIILYLYYEWTGTITMKLKDMKAVFSFQDNYRATADVGKQGMDIIRTYAKNTPFEVSINRG